MPLISFIAAVWIAFAQAGPAVSPSRDLAAARSLYDSGAYEDALIRLATVRDDRLAAEAAQYRALCLVALGRNSEAQHALEDLFTRMPLFKMSETEVAPRVVAMYQQVRRRLLPGMAKDIYAKGKASFEQRQYPAAAAHFETVLALLAGDEDAEDAPGLPDLKLLADGFLKLAQGQLAAEPRPDVKASAMQAENTPASPPERAATALAGPPAAAVSRPATAPAIYSAAAPDVMPPVELVRKLPAWHPPNGVAARRAYEGVLRIVIDERGSVESANMVESVAGSYDDVLLAAARLWQYKPAQKSGHPVKYEKLITITLNPGAGRS
jgi:tetratricopeptide (TPR) repeat protein